MARSAAWSGYFRLSLVAFPVKGYRAASASAKIVLNQLHALCHSRIRYQKVCPRHGPVTNEEIVRGYEYENGKYAVVTAEDLANLRTGAERSITVDAFAKAGTVDTIYYTDRSYYLLPGGSVARHPYGLIHRVMEDGPLEAVARVYLASRERLALLQPRGKLLMMTLLNEESEVKDVSDFEKEIEAERLAPSELKLTKTLVQTLLEEKLDYGRYKDEYLNRLRELIEAKVEGQEIAAPPSPEEGEAIDLMDALRRSLMRVKTAASTRKPNRKPATKRPAKGRKQKRG